MELTQRSNAAAIVKDADMAWELAKLIQLLPRDDQLIEYGRIMTCLEKAGIENGTLLLQAKTQAAHSANPVLA